jgi:WD repeat-containing protein 35
LKVLQLLRSGGNDAEMEETWNKIGDYFAERHKWDEAVQYYEKARNVDQVEKTLNLAFLQRRKINN